MMLSTGMKDLGRVIIVATVSVISSSAPAHADRNWHIGWMGGIIQPTVSDPAGPTDSTSTTQWKDVVFMHDYSRDYRLLAMAKQHSYTLDASPTNIGQDVDHTGIGVTVQKNLRLTRSFKPWIGAGLGYASETYEPRYLVTPTGFLSVRYPDRKQTGVAVIANATAQWASLASTQTGVHLQYEHGMGELSRLLSVSLFISY